MPKLSVCIGRSASLHVESVHPTTTNLVHAATVPQQLVNDALEFWTTECFSFFFFKLWT